MEKKRHVLSIQSHVVSGYVGNKCATFPLQLLGFEVDAINSVQFSNHTGYKIVKGEVLNDVHLSQLAEGISDNDLDHYSHLLTGYVGSASFLKRIAQLVPILKQKNPNLIYVCDPVMGDNGKLYVPDELVNIYKNEIVPLADILTPNQFELGLLVDQKISSLNDVKEAILKLHGKGPKTVVVSSTEIDNKLEALVSNSIDKCLIKIEIPKIPTNYTGSGDLFAALFLAHSHYEAELKTALEKTINSLHSVLLKTYEYRQGFNDETAQKAKTKELRLIQSKYVIENPPDILKAQYL